MFRSFILQKGFTVLCLCSIDFDGVCIADCQFQHRSIHRIWKRNVDGVGLIEMQSISIDFVQFQCEFPFSSVVRLWQCIGCRSGLVLKSWLNLILREPFNFQFYLILFDIKIVNRQMKFYIKSGIKKRTIKIN